MGDVPAIALSAFALRIASRPRSGNWLALQVPANQQSRIGEGLADELQMLAKRKVAILAGLSNARELARATRHESDRLVIATGLDEFSCAEWQALDSMRSGLEAASSTAILLSDKQVNLLAACAPNLGSWL